MHGLGENGNGNSELSRVLHNGPPRLINRDNWNASLPFIVLSPQHSGGGCTSSNEINAMIDFALGQYAVNVDRVYLTGLSCGANGSWNHAGNFINSQVAAMVPIAGKTFLPVPQGNDECPQACSSLDSRSSSRCSFSWARSRAAFWIS